MISIIDELAYTEKNWVLLWLSRIQLKPGREYNYRKGLVKKCRTDKRVEQNKKCRKVMK